MKVASGFYQYRLPDGSRVSQPVIYAHALDGCPSEAGTRVRRVGTLSRNPGTAPKGDHPLRCGDVGWSDVRNLLHAAPPTAGISAVVGELIEAINARILPTPPPAEEVKALLDWSQGALRRPSRFGIPGRRHDERQGNARSEAPDRGGFVDYRGPDGAALRMWAYASPAGVGYSGPGEPHAVYLQPDQERKASPALQAQLAQGFQWERDIAGWDAWRTWVSAAEVQAAGTAPAQEALLVEAFVEALEAAGLIASKP